MNKQNKENNQEYEKNSLKIKKKQKNKAFKVNYFDFYNDVKTTPRQDWWVKIFIY